ncbi:Hypothetical protein I595_941 [Croceitalea dokdonensis DOKDO 023]|uniref:Uncharacterized protein n=1 Tax=Croceitalea dokdonensis DOKDO 023 TaxID=1300341 RepID=A0A0P7B0R7_9FLAO|nr:hypothetical protein [Croceitalea dokdonensis]KPM32523.1 Hypothetical protein I595_941 [Croceitalea dokdonensis DOKDO 023]
MNQLSLQLKRLGKKKVKTIDVVLDSTPKNLKQLIGACVRHEVKKYNEKREGDIVLSFLNATEIQEQGETGKIVFGDLANKTLAAEETAIENALLAHKDGLYLVFVDDHEITDLEHPLNLTQKSVFTFMRMTFLSGAYW